jgi:hypothetical protein
MTWTENTKIQYAPNRKSGKSFIRYGKYMKAKTVGEALKLGSYGLDLLFDYEKKLLWSVGGPKRERPPEILKRSKEELQSMCQTDKMLGKMYAKWKTWKASFKAMEENGFTRQELKQLSDSADPEGGRDSILVAIGRRKAQTRAKAILDAIKKEGGRRITDEEVLSCLQLWGFKENENRGNVMPDGQTFVYSDTIGMIKQSTSERTLLTVGTKQYPEFTQVLTQWLKEQLPAKLAANFPYTSININKNYAGKLHRDGNNVGPSLIRALGDFSKGELNYWPGDPMKIPLEDLKQKDKLTVNIKDNLMLFDGNRGHYVNPFKGERYSLVFFSIRTWNKVPEKDAKEGRKAGIPLPDKKTMAEAQKLLGPAKENGFRYWPSWSSKGDKTKGAKRALDTVPTPTKRRRQGEAPKVTPEKTNANPVETVAGLLKKAKSGR